MLICDTSGLLALADGDDPAHHTVARAFARAEPPYVVSPLVLAEVGHLLRVRAGGSNARAALRVLTSGQFEVAALASDEVHAAIDLDERHSDLDLGLTHCTVMVLAERFRTVDLLTLDERGFRAVKPPHGDSFRLLPADADADR